MRQIHRRPGRHTLLCTLCGQEISQGEEYWIMNGTTVCGACLPDFARAELAAFRRTRGKEARL